MANDKALDKARKLLKKAIDGDKHAASSAGELLGKLREKEPDHALVEAYYGSSLALMARDAVKPLDKADLAQEALDALDRAVAMDPDDKEIRILRANVCLRLPESYFHCSKTAIEDFTLLLERNNEKKGYLTSKQVDEIQRDLRIAYQNAGKANEANAALQRIASSNVKKK